MMNNNLKLMFLSGTIALSLSTVNTVDNSFIASSSNAKFDCMKSSSNSYESFGDSSSNVSRGTNIYNYQSNSVGIINSSLDLFGDMRNLTMDEEASYVKGLADISESTGVSLF